MLPMKKNNLYGQRPGVSLIIALVLVGIITFFAVITSIGEVDSIRLSSAANNSSVASYAAEGAMETGAEKNLEQGVGYNTTGKSTILFGGDPECMAKATTALCSTCCQCNYGTTCPNQHPYDSINLQKCTTACNNANKPSSNVKSTFTIQGTVPQNRKYTSSGSSSFYNMYGVPTPGTGNAGNNCDSLNAYFDKTFNFTYKDQGGNPTTLINVDAAENPCNWNKIKVGGSVAIPLYITSGGVIKNPVDLGLTDLRIRVRTPCKYGNEMCPENLRYQLADDVGDDNFKCDSDTPTRCGDTIMAWNISGSNKGGDKTYNLGPNTEYKASYYYRDVKNSEIYERLINNQTSPFNCGTFCMLGITSSINSFGIDTDGQKGKIYDFLWNSAIPFVRIGDDVINKPVLKLSVVHSLQDKDNAQNALPYLEYQVLSNVGNSFQPANAYQTITGESISGSFKQIMELKVPQENSILDYVIQQ